MGDKAIKIAVVGAAGIGLVYWARQALRPGETALAESCEVVLGGKAGNQAAAIAKLGGSPHLVSFVGDDMLGGLVRSELLRLGVVPDNVVIRKGETTLNGSTIVDSSGENAVLVATGVIGKLTAEDVEKALPDLSNFDLCLISGDGFPGEAMVAAARRARAAGVLTVLNPAPPPSGALLRQLAEVVDVITPNEVEARDMTGQTSDDPEVLTSALREMGFANIVMTCGGRGSFVRTADLAQHVAAVNYGKVRDTAGAGDAFNAALSVALAHGCELPRAALFANHAASIVTLGIGLISAMQAWDDLLPDTISPTKSERRRNEDS